MSGDVVEVRLLRLPVAVHNRVDQHMRGLQREFDLIRFGDPDTTSVPNRLQALVEGLNAQFGGFGVDPQDALQAATARGDSTIDLVYQIPASVGPAAEHLGDMLDEVDEYCRSRGHLLTLVAPPEALAYRQWFLGEFVRQSAGEEPVPWTERHVAPTPAQPAVVIPPSATHAAVPASWTVERSDRQWELRVDGPLDLVSAPALRDVLVDLTSESADGVVDLTECGFIDSVGVSVLLAGLSRANEHEVALRFRLSSAVERVLDVAGVLGRIELGETS